MGITGDEARLRARIVYSYQVAEQNLARPDSPALRRRLDRLRLEMLTRREKRASSARERSGR